MPRRYTTRRVRKRRRSVVLLGKSRRVRVKGHRNTTDKSASRKNRKRRVKNYVNNPDTTKKGRSRKNHHRSSSM